MKYYLSDQSSRDFSKAWNAFVTVVRDDAIRTNKRNLVGVINKELKKYNVRWDENRYPYFADETDLVHFVLEWS